MTSISCILRGARLLVDLAIISESETGASDSQIGVGKYEDSRDIGTRNEITVLYSTVRRAGRGKD